MRIWAQSWQAATWPPSAAVRQLSMADMTLSWPRLKCPARAWRQAGPWARKMSATSKLSRGMTPPGQAGGSFRCSSGLLTACRVVLATWA